MSRAIGQLLRLARLNSGLSLGQVAKATAATRGNICNLEQGRIEKPGFDFIRSLCRLYKISLEKLP